MNRPASFEDLLVTGALLAGSGAVLWSSAIACAVLLEALSDGRVRLAGRLGCPDRAHRWLLAAVTAALTAVLVAPPAGAEGQQVPAAPVLDGLPLPDRLADELPSNLRAREPPAVSGWVTVLPGDSLWQISRRQLPRDAPAVAIAARTRSLYDLNRSILGADPDLIHPGQRLHLPPDNHETYSEDS